MKRLLSALGMVFVLSWTCIAQTSAADAPATKEDVERYLQVVHSHDTMKHKDNLPDDYESKMTARMDDMFESMPWDEMIQAMAPVYEKHFTKGDIDSLVSFYSSPTGQKMLREMPSIMTESMQSMTPIMMKYVETVQKRLQKDTDVMIAQSKKASSANTPVTHN
jgi:hypothetical protein